MAKKDFIDYIETNPYLLDWESGSVNDQLIKYLKENNIDWCYDMQEIVFNINGIWFSLYYNGTVNGKIPLRFKLVERLNK